MFMNFSCYDNFLFLEPPEKTIMEMIFLIMYNKEDQKSAQNNSSV